MVDVSSDIEYLFSEAERLTKSIKIGLDKQLENLSQHIKIKLKENEKNGKKIKV